MVLEGTLNMLQFHMSLSLSLTLGPKKLHQS